MLYVAKFSRDPIRLLIAIATAVSRERARGTDLRGLSGGIVKRTLGRVIHAGTKNDGRLSAGRRLICRDDVASVRPFIFPRSSRVDPALLFPSRGLFFPFSSRI